MGKERSTLSRLAENRQRRMADGARPSFDLTAEELRQSTETAMRLADATPQQVADAQSPRPADRPSQAA
jgi:hypothetical protein